MQILRKNMQKVSPKLVTANS